MCDMYYDDTRRVLDKVEQLDLDAFSCHYREPIELLCSETDGLLAQYLSVVESNDSFQERIEELEGIVENLRELLEDNEES